MTLNEYKTKRAGLLNEMQAMIDEGKLENVDAKKAEIEALDARWETTRQALADLNALKDLAIPDNVGAVGTSASVNMEDAVQNESLIGVGSDAYRNAFLLTLAGRSKELTKLENAAFIHVTGDENAPLPKQMMDKIWDQICGEHTILEDVDIYRSGVALEIPIAKAVTQGKAKKVAEGQPNDDMKFEWGQAKLNGNDFSADVDISYAEAKMALPALEKFISDQLADQIGEAMAEDAVATIKAGMAGGNKVTSAAAKATNYAELASVFAKLVKVKDIKVYMRNSTLYDNIIGMVGTDGRPIFDPAAGKVLRGTLREEDAVGEHEILIGDPKKFKYNMVQDIMLESAKTIKNHSYTYAGYARGEGALIFDTAFAMLTIKQA